MPQIMRQSTKIYTQKELVNRQEKTEREIISRAERVFGVSNSIRSTY